MPMDRRSDEEKRETMVAERQIRQNNAQAIVRDLHDAGFSHVWIDSTQVSGDGHFWQRVIVNDAEISHDRMTMIMEIADVHDGHVGLHEYVQNDHRFSRIALWPSSED